MTEILSEGIPSDASARNTNRGSGIFACQLTGQFSENAGVIPAPLQLSSASPWMMDMVWKSIQYLSQHPN